MTVSLFSVESASNISVVVIAILLCNRIEQMFH